MMKRIWQALLLCSVSCVNATTLSKQEFTNFLTKEMEEQKILQPTIDKIPDAMCTQNLIDAFKNLSYDLRPGDKRFILQVLFNCGPKIHNKAYVETVKLLSECMPEFDRVNIMRTVAKVTNDQYQNFVDAMLLLSLQLTADDLRYVFRIFCDVKVDIFPILIQFIQTQNFFFDLVPCSELGNRISFSSTAEEIKGILGSLFLQYKRMAKKNQFPDALAFEIHQYAQHTFEDQNDLPLCKLVMYRLHHSVKKRLTYRETLGKLQMHFILMKKEYKNNDAITKEVYDWMIKNHEDRQDQMTLAAIVSYLIEIDPSCKKLRTWLAVYMEECKNAYKSGQTNSCVQGVKERAVTTLRSVGLDDPNLAQLFSQAESYLLTTTKAKKLADYAYWAAKLKEVGVTAETPIVEAKNIFEHILQSFFSEDKDAENIIQSTLEMFEDSDETTPDGIWVKIKNYLL